MPYDLDIIRYLNHRTDARYRDETLVGEDANDKNIAKKDWYVRGKALQEALGSKTASFGAGYVTGAAVTVAGVVTGVAAAPLVPAVLAAGGVAAYVVSGRARVALSSPPSVISLDDGETLRRSAKAGAGNLEGASVVGGNAAYAHRSVGLRQRTLSRSLSTGDLSQSTEPAIADDHFGRPTMAAGRPVARLSTEQRQAKITSGKNA